MKQPVLDNSLIAALEILAAHFQWQSSTLQIDRQPDGSCRFWAYVNPDNDKGLGSYSAFGETPDEAVQKVIKQCPMANTPEVIREQTIRELEARLEKLRAAVFPMPPYRPGTYLAENVSSQTIEI